MDDITSAWKELDKLFGPNWDKRSNEIRLAAQKYARAIFESNDNNRIQVLGRRHLEKVSEMELDSKQLSTFLTHVIRMRGKADDIYA